MRWLRRVRWVRVLALGLAVACVALQARVTRLETELGDLRRLVGSMEARGVETSVVIPGPPIPAIDGSVMLVRADLFPPVALLSVGRDDGVQEGYHFTIYRGSRFVAKVVVEDAMLEASWCRVLFSAEGEQVRAGDQAATRLQ